MCGQDGDNRAHHLILNGKDILEVTIVVLGPAMRTRGSIDQLRGNSNAVAAAPYAAFQHIAYAQFASYLPHIDRLVLVLEAGVAGDDKQLGEAGQLSDDVVDDAVDQIFLLWMGSQVGERKHGNRGFVRKRKFWRRCLLRFHRHRDRDCQIVCVRGFRDGGARFVVSIESEASEAWSARLLGCSKRSSPKAA